MQRRRRGGREAVAAGPTQTPRPRGAAHGRTQHHTRGQDTAPGNGVEAPRKVPDRTILAPNDSTAGDLADAIQNTNWKGRVHPVFTAAMLTQPRYGSSRKARHSGRHLFATQYYSAVEKDTILPLGTPWMHLEGIMLSGKRQAEKDRYRTISLTRGI